MVTAFWPKPAEIDRAEGVRSAGVSDLHLFRYRQCIVHLDAEMADRAFDLGVTEQELRHGGSRSEARH